MNRSQIFTYLAILLGGATIIALLPSQYRCMAFVAVILSLAAYAQSTYGKAFRELAGIGQDLAPGETLIAMGILLPTSLEERPAAILKDTQASFHLLVSRPNELLAIRSISPTLRRPRIDSPSYVVIWSDAGPVHFAPRRQPLTSQAALAKKLVSQLTQAGVPLHPEGRPPA